MCAVEGEEMWHGAPHGGDASSGGGEMRPDLGSNGSGRGRFERSRRWRLGPEPIGEMCGAVLLVRSWQGEEEQPAWWCKEEIRVGEEEGSRRVGVFRFGGRMVGEEDDLRRGVKK